MAGLQSRLQAVFGTLGTDNSEAVPAWQPTTAYIFRGGGIEQDAGSSDDEAEEARRRQSLPGAAMQLIDEDEPDSEGFKPSAAFCRQLDVEGELEAADAMAVGDARAARPPPGTEVAEDNPYEQALSRWQAQAGGAAAAPATTRVTAVAMAPGGFTTAGVLSLHSSCEGFDDAQLPASAPEERSSLWRDDTPAVVKPAAGRPSPPRPRPALAGTRTRVSKKRVSWDPAFQDKPRYVPPHLREGYTPELAFGSSLPPPPGGIPPPLPSSDSEHTLPQPQQQLAPSASRVPHHVTHPESYTRYDLEHALIVGGGVGQLKGEEERAADIQEAAAAASVAAASAAAAAVGDPAEAHVEEERWQGEVGGGISFRPREQRSGSGTALATGNGAAAAAATGVGTTDSTVAGATAAAVLSSYEEDTGMEVDEVEEGVQEERLAPRQPAGQRRYRSTAATMTDE